MTRFFLGADIGGTKSHVLIADETGSAVGFGESGSGNPEGVGYEGLAQAIAEATRRALASAGLTLKHIAGAGYGIAGYDWPSQRAITLHALQLSGITAPLEIVNDTVIGLLAGAAEGWGVAVVSGTGCNCRGWDRQHREGRVVGMGEFSSEAGGASETVARALLVISHEWIKRGPATALTPAFVQRVGARDASDLIEGLCTNRYHIDAEAAPLVVQVAESGDPVAQDLLRWVGRELGELANSVIRQLGLEAEAVEVVQVGSMYNIGALLTEPMRETICALAPRARLVRLTAPPVVGGVLLGMEQAGLNGYFMREHLIETTQKLLNHR